MVTAVTTTSTFWWHPQPHDTSACLQPAPTTLIFGVPQQKDNFQWAFDAAQTMSDHFGNIDYRRAQARSAQLASQADFSLKVFYEKKKKISIENFV
ncbi:hypothetical protein E2C01_036947 [Portunus trituberculatus]|uniref:Uncharacterized protein n=1 Tax=Portunus trituberculatus TaxID=210409 RepID=A0A5B7FDU6_PORTR|nr:hypothetical protein [Portunus trituberculatus]